MKLIETRISRDTVSLFYGDGATKDESKEWVEIQVKAPGDDNRRLGAIQKDVLERVQALIALEMNRFGKLSDQIHAQRL